jgi:hypothetical protein
MNLISSQIISYFPNHLFHGTSEPIQGNYLLPKPSQVLQGEEAVFATNRFDFAVLFIAKWTDRDFEFGIVNGKAYCMEMYPNAFDILKKASGVVYLVQEEYFKTDERLGMKNHEFISKQKVPIDSYVKVGNVWEELNSINLITFEQKWDALEKLLIK